MPEFSQKTEKPEPSWVIQAIALVVVSAGLLITNMLYFNYPLVGFVVIFPLTICGYIWYFRTIPKTKKPV